MNIKIKMKRDHQRTKIKLADWRNMGKRSRKRERRKRQDMKKGNEISERIFLP